MSEQPRRHAEESEHLWPGQAAAARCRARAGRADPRWVAYEKFQQIIYRRLISETTARARARLNC